VRGGSPPSAGGPLSKRRSSPLLPPRPAHPSPMVASIW
jgi:hypothetical protein